MLSALVDVKKLEEEAFAFAEAARMRSKLILHALSRGVKYSRGTYAALWSDLNSNPAAGSVEAERAFSGMNYVKPKTRNRLEPEHLSVALRLKLHSSYSVDSFPYEKALRKYLGSCQRRNMQGRARTGGQETALRHLAVMGNT